MPHRPEAPVLAARRAVSRRRPGAAAGARPDPDPRHPGDRGSTGCRRPSEPTAPNPTASPGERSRGGSAVDDSLEREHALRRRDRGRARVGTGCRWRPPRPPRRRASGQCRRPAPCPRRPGRPHARAGVGQPERTGDGAHAHRVGDDSVRPAAAPQVAVGRRGQARRRPGSVRPGTVRCPTMTAGAPAAKAASNAAGRAGQHAQRRTRAAPVWALAAWPWPGQCLTTGSTPALSRPVDHAAASRAGEWPGRR